MTRTNPSSTSANQLVLNAPAHQLVVPTKPELEISQEMLSIFQELREANRETARIRTILLARLDAGATVEPGTFSVELRQGETQRLTWKLLESTFDVDFAAMIRGRIPKSISRRIIVRKNPW